MTTNSDWTFSAGEWRRTLARQTLVVRPLDIGAWAWRVETPRMRVLDDGEATSLDIARAAAEHRGKIVKYVLCHAMGKDGHGKNWDLAEDDIPMAGDIEAAGFPAY